MEWIKNFIEQQRLKQKERKEKEVEKRAEEIYQVTEYDGELWFTYNGHLFCPCGLLSCSDVVDEVEKIRELYIKRNTNNN